MLLPSIVLIGVNPETAACANVELPFFAQQYCLFTHTHCTCWKSHITASPPAHDTAVLKIRSQIQIRPLLCSAQWQSTFIFFQHCLGSFQFQSDFSLLVQRLPVRPEGRLSTSSGPTAMTCFCLLTLETTQINSMDQIEFDASRPVPINGNILIWAVKICSAFWANSSSHWCFLQVCWPISLLQGLLRVFSSPDNGHMHTGALLREDR